MSNVSDESQRKPATFEAASLYVVERPQEMMATLTWMEFQVLLDGEQTELRANRDLCFGVFVSSAIGAVGLLATIDWGIAFREGRWSPFLWTGAMFCAVVAALLGTLIFSSQYRKAKSKAAYSALVKRLRDGFSSV